jgi:hypothetical protein
VWLEPATQEQIFYLDFVQLDRVLIAIADELIKPVPVIWMKLGAVRVV